MTPDVNVLLLTVVAGFLRLLGRTELTLRHVPRSILMRAIRGGANAKAGDTRRNAFVHAWRSVVPGTCADSLREHRRRA